MKKSLFIAAALAGVSLVSSVSAFTAKDSVNLAALGARPVPDVVVNPVNLPRPFGGAIVSIEFSVDEAGQPRNVRILSSSAAGVEKQMLQAFTQWRFRSSGPTAIVPGQRFVIPVQINLEA